MPRRDGNKKRGVTPNLVVGALVLIVVAACVFAIAAVQGRDSKALYALVHDGDGQTHALELSSDGDFTVATELGTNTVRIQDGRASIVEADCAGGDCMRQKAIEKPGEQLICLPHKLWVEVVAEGEAGGEMSVDAVQAQEGEVDLVAR